MYFMLLKAFSLKVNGKVSAKAFKSVHLLFRLVLDAIGHVWKRRNGDFIAFPETCHVFNQVEIVQKTIQSRSSSTKNGCVRWKAYPG